MCPTKYIGEDHSKQEVQGSAEQLAAPVLQPSIPPAPVTFPRERTAADLPSSKESGFGETIAVVQSTAAIADHKTEVIKLAFFFNNPSPLLCIGLLMLTSIVIRVSLPNRQLIQILAFQSKMTLDVSRLAARIFVC